MLTGAENRMFVYECGQRRNFLLRDGLRARYHKPFTTICRQISKLCMFV